MAVFAYKAVSADSPGTTFLGRGAIEAKALKGTVVADTPRQARDQLRSRGLIIEDIRPVENEGRSKRRSSFIFAISFGTRRRRRAQVTSFVRELATLVGVGIPLLEAIDTIVNQYRGRFRTCLLLLKNAVAEGNGLANAMRQQPEYFDDLCINVVDVGENAGNLDEVLERLADHLEQAMQFRSRIVSALLYPAIVLCTGIGVSIFLMTYVVPNLLETLLESGRPLPLMTQIVKTISDFLLYQWWIILLAIIGIVAAIALTLRTTGGRLAWHRLQLKIPVIGPLIRKQAITRLAIIISTLMRTGIPFVRAVEIARASTKNLVLGQALELCEQAVVAGRDIGEAVQQTGAFPPTVVQIFTVGQQSGRLEDMLTRLARDYDRQVEVATGRLASIIEPVLIVLLAIVVGCIAFATILPILEAGNVL